MVTPGTEPELLPAVVVRCITCNVEIITNGKVPENCSICGRKMERRRQGAVITIQREGAENAAEAQDTAGG